MFTDASHKEECMQLRPIPLALCLSLSLSSACASKGGEASALETPTTTKDSLEEMHLGQLHWLDLHDDMKIPFFAKGGSLAIVHGQPFDSTYHGEYIVRFDLPKAYKVPPHWHPMAENVTVLEGEYLLGNGAVYDLTKTVSYKPGDYGHTPACAPQYGTTTVRTVIEVHGEAPFAFHNLESNDPKDSLSNCKTR